MHPHDDSLRTLEADTCVAYATLLSRNLPETSQIRESELSEEYKRQRDRVSLMFLRAINALPYTSSELHNSYGLFLMEHAREPQVLY